ncbi:MAG: hypothetical protein MI757_22355, partial [Pirellulales bacterium]|nr:hypothetical protein [Pirellulales bacterium]
MNTQSRTSTQLTLATAAVVTLALAANAANATLVVYEPFDYSAGLINGTQAGGTGLSGTGWNGTTDNVQYSVLSPGLTFTGLSTSGNKLQRASAPGSAQISRELTGSAITALTADNTTIYFSLLMQNNRFSTGNANDAFL